MSDVNEPCQLDERDWCERHERHHTGNSRRAALDPGPIGQAWRGMLDRVAGRKRERPALPALPPVTPAERASVQAYKLARACIHRGPQIGKCTKCGELPVYECQYESRRGDKVTVKDCVECSFKTGK